LHGADGAGRVAGDHARDCLEICRSGPPTNKRVIKPEALRNSAGIFVTQTALGIVPVMSFDRRNGGTFTATDQIAGAYNEMLGTGIGVIFKRDLLNRFPAAINSNLGWTAAGLNARVRFCKKPSSRRRSRIGD